MLTGVAVALIAGMLAFEYKRWRDRAAPQDVGFWLGSVSGAVASGFGSDWLVRTVGDHVVRYTPEWYFSVGFVALAGGVLCGSVGAFVGFVRAARRGY